MRAQDIDILVTTCSIYCPTPSMASMVVNAFKLRKDVQVGGCGVTVWVSDVGQRYCPTPSMASMVGNASK